MFVRRRRYKLTLLHIAAPAIIWTYVYAYASVAGELENADVAVANVSFAFFEGAASEHIPEISFDETITSSAQAIHQQRLEVHT